MAKKSRTPIKKIPFNEHPHIPNKSGTPTRKLLDNEHPQTHNKNGTSINNKSEILIKHGLTSDYRYRYNQGKVKNSKLSKHIKLSTRILNTLNKSFSEIQDLTQKGKNKSSAEELDLKVRVLDRQKRNQVREEN